MSSYGNYLWHPSEEAEQTTPTKFDEMSQDKLDALVNKAALSNQDRQAEALTKADAYAFQIANPQFKRTDKNTRIMNHQLTSWGITNPTYEDFARAYDALAPSGLLDIDDKVEAPKTFKGHFTGKTFDSIDDLVLNERHASLRAMPVSQEEIELEKVPLEQLKDIAKGREHAEQLSVVASKNQRAGDAWVLVTPWYRDTQLNAKLMRQQLATNGVLESAATISDYETAGHQLRAAGLLSVNQVALNKQHQETLRQEATEALKPEPTEEEMYAMPMAELEAHARGWK